MKNIKYIFIGILLAIAGTAFAYPYFNYSQTIIPQKDNGWDLGTTTQAWRNIYTNKIFFATTTAGCATISSGGEIYSVGTACGSGSGGSDPFTHPATGISATTSQLNMVGFLSTASSTIVGNATTTSNQYVGSFTIGTTSIGCLQTSASGGITYIGSCSGGSGVTSVGSASGITGGTITTSGTLSLINWLATSSAETNGQVPYWTTTSGWPAKLNSVGTSTPSIGTVLTYSGTLGNMIGGASGTFGIANGAVTDAMLASTFLKSYDAWTHPASLVSATTSQINMVGLLDTASTTIVGNATTTGTFAVGSYLSVATSSPWAQLSVGSTAGIPQFAIGSSTATSFLVDKNGAVAIGNPTANIGGYSGITLTVGGGSANTNAANIEIIRGISSGTSLIGNTTFGDTSNSTLARFGANSGTANNKGNLFFSTSNGSSLIEAMRITENQQVGIGTTTTTYPLDISTTTGPQIALSNGAGISQWTLANEGGVFYLATTTTAGNATSSISALKVDANGFLTLPANAGVGCGQFDANGKLTNTGTACGSGSGVTSVIAGAGFQNQGLNITTSGTLVGAFASSATPSLSNVPYITGVGDASNPIKFGFLATTTLSGSGVISVTAGATTFGSSPISISCATCGTLSSYDAWTHPFTSLYSATTSVMMIGTSTPAFSQLTIGTSTVPQLTLTDNTTTNTPWSLRSVGSNLYFSTSSATTLATTSPAAMSITGTGYPTFGLGTTTPFALVSIANISGAATPLFAVASSTGTSGMPVLELDQYGHPITSGPKPTISSCGTGSPSVTGNDENMTITTGTGAPTECTGSFANTWPTNSTVVCNPTDTSNVTATLYASTTATTFKVGLSVGLTSGTFTLSCQAYQ